MNFPRVAVEQAKNHIDNGADPFWVSHMIWVEDGGEWECHGVSNPLPESPSGACGEPYFVLAEIAGLDVWS